MKHLRSKASCAVALVLLSLVINTNAYGIDRLWGRFSERVTSAALRKLPPSLAKNIVTGVALASFFGSAYVTSSLIFNGVRPQPTEKSVDSTEALPDRGTVEITTQTYEQEKQVDLALAALYLGVGLTGVIIFFDSTYWFTYEKYPHPEHYPHPTIAAFLIGGGGLTTAVGFTGLLVNLGG